MKELVYKYNIGDSYVIGDSEFIIVDRMIDIDKHGKRIKKYYVKCKKCGDVRWKDEKYLFQSINGTKSLSGKGCKHCNQRNKANSENCIATTDPWMIPLLKDKSDAYRYTSGSGQKVWFVCPFCGEEKYITPKQVCRDHKLCCNKCGDGITYPNKFGYALLKQLKVDNLTPEYSDDWTLGHRYDFYFTKHGIKYLLEMDGWFHYEDAFNQTTLERNIVNDQIKDRLAEENGYHLIRIDCRLSDFGYIKNNVYLSELSIIFDLSDIDWGQVEKECVSNKIIEVCSYYKEHPSETMRNIGKIFNINPSTVTGYLEIGNDCGIIVFVNKREAYKQKYTAVVGYRNAGMSVKEIQNVSGIKDYTIYKIIRKGVESGDIIEQKPHTQDNTSIKEGTNVSMCL